MSKRETVFYKVWQRAIMVAEYILVPVLVPIAFVVLPVYWLKCVVESVMRHSTRTRRASVNKSV